MTRVVQILNLFYLFESQQIIVANLDYDIEVCKGLGWQMRDDFSNGPGRQIKDDFSNGPGRQKRNVFSNGRAGL